MIYNLAAFVIWVICLPFIIIMSFKKKYRKSLPARFFLYKNPKFNPCEVHFHACSLGEINAISSLVKNFKNLSITTTTNTGFEAAKKLNENSRFLPFEVFLPFWLEKSKVTIVFEAELWLNLVKYAKKNSSYVVLLNARISDRSYNNYLKLKFYYKEVFKNIDLVLAQSQKDARRLEELGAKNVKVFGNIKTCASLPSKKYVKFANKRLITIASTHEGEEKLILSNLKYFKNDKIVLAPRHPERFDKVHEIFKSWAQSKNLTYERYSCGLQLESECILLDTLGEIINFYAISDVVILAGSFLPQIGGHNPIEAAQFNVPIISGMYFHNQHTLYNMVENIQIIKIKDLNQALSSSLKPTSVKNSCDLNKILNIIKEKI